MFWTLPSRPACAHPQESIVLSPRPAGGLRPVPGDPRGAGKILLDGPADNVLNVLGNGLAEGGGNYAHVGGKINRDANLNSLLRHDAECNRHVNPFQRQSLASMIR